MNSVRKFLTLLLFLTHFAFAGISPECVIAIASNSCHVRSAVHAPTGQFFLHRTDAVIPGFEPIPITRTYVSDSVAGLNWKGAWVFFPHLEFYIQLAEGTMLAEIQEPDGAFALYKLQSDQITMLPDLGKYYAPPFGREISGRTDIRNNRLVLTKNPKAPPAFIAATFYLGNGGKRIYKINRKDPGASKWLFLLEEEVKPNGNRVLYFYDDSDRLKEIKTQNPTKTKVYATALFDYRGKKEKDRDFTLTGSDERAIHYRFMRPDENHLHPYFYLSGVTGDTVAEEFSYDMGYKIKDDKDIKRVKKEIEEAEWKGESYKKKARYETENKTRAPFVKHVDVGEGALFGVTYYQPQYNTSSIWGARFIAKATDSPCEKVMDLLEPVGQGGAMQATHSFSYETNCTKVKDLYGNETHYYFGDHFRLVKIDYFKPDGLVRSEKFIWDGPDLKWHIFCDPTGKNSFGRFYDYDIRGNVKKEILYGDLTGTSFVSFDPANPSKSGVETYAITYTYSEDGFNLPFTKAEDSGLTTLYIYKKGTDLLTSKFIRDHEMVLIRHFYKYNDDNFLYEEITEDGQNPVTERKVTRYTPNKFNYPEIIEEYALDVTTGQMLLQQKRKLHYSAKHQLEKVEVLDVERDGALYELITTYKDYKVESQSDPLGYLTTSKYNKRHQLSEQHKTGGAVETFRYKPTGLLVEKESKDKATGVVWTTTYDYDGLLYKTFEKDPFEAITRFKHDRFGNLMTSTHGKSSHTSEYDFLGRPITQTDPKDHVTTTAYNARGQPTLIIHPTGEERFLYYLDGTLKEHTDADGIRVEYEHDVLDRVLSKKTYSSTNVLVAEEKKIYTSFHPSSETDACDYEIAHEYNLGRKVAETRAGRRIEFTYDNLGQIEKITQGDLATVTKRDFLGQVFEERQELTDGTVLQKRQYTYNPLGLVETETRFTDAGAAVYTTKYDAFGQVVEVTDPLDHKTTIDYTLKPHTQITTDPLKRKKIESFNSIGKLEKVERQNSSGKTLSLEEYFYDRSGNRERELSTIYFQGQVLKKIETEWKYGPGDRLEELIESSNTLSIRKTQYEYTPKGLLKKTTKPNGVALKYTYDPFSNLSTLISSDGSIDYFYEHDHLGRMFAVTDQNTSLKTTREIDPFGNVLKETLANGFVLGRSYDALDQCKSLTLPDGSSVTKSYDGIHLKTVSRMTASNELVFAHTFAEYDLSGHVIREELANGKQSSYDIDILGRYKGIQAPGYTQSIEEFDEVGKVKKIITQGAPTVFEYDDLGQLVSENSETFGYDSNYNRRLHNTDHQTVDDLNQLVVTEDSVFTYDPCGNIETKTTGSEVLRFSHDALDRLINVQKSDGSQFIYTYDPLHRRLTKTGNGKTTRYLYDGQNEIGIVSNGHFTLRILGDAPQAEIGASIALEVGGHLYFPIHDLQGSIAALWDPMTKMLAEECSYTAFGVESISSDISPWGYLSKGKDPETGFVFFGRRYYDPAVGRWMTTDPKGYTDSMNLYAFALNDPFTLADPYGLENETMQKISSAGAFTLNSVGQGFIHPIDTAWAISGDLAGIVNATAAWDFSSYTAAWRSMSREERLHLFTSRGLQIGGAAGAAALAVPRTIFSIGRGACYGAEMVYTGARGAFSSISTRLFSRGVASTENQLANAIANEAINPYAGIKRASQYLQKTGVNRARRVSILQSFDSQNIVVRQAGPSEFGLRYYSSQSRMGGNYLFETFPASRQSLAIRPEWNTMSGFRQYQIKPGTVIIEGRAAPQGSCLRGGQIQKFIVNWREDLILP